MILYCGLIVKWNHPRKFLQKLLLKFVCPMQSLFYCNIIILRQILFALKQQNYLHKDMRKRGIPSSSALWKNLNLWIFCNFMMIMVKSKGRKWIPEGCAYEEYFCSGRKVYRPVSMMGKRKGDAYVQEC